MENSPRRPLTIGEYAAATQLTAKALRLYDEHALIKPGAVDPSTGYRYYHADQVTTGRLVRTLRDMNLSLAHIKRILDTPRGLQAALLREFLYEAEQRLARERTAYQSAVLMLRSQTRNQATEIDELSAAPELVVLFQLLTNRESFIEHALQQRTRALTELKSANVRVQGECAFALLEPLTDDDTRVELAIPIATADASLGHLTTRHQPQRRYASVHASDAAFFDGWTSSIDALFDWFDRKGVHAVGHPEVVLRIVDDELQANVRWAFATTEHT